VCRFEEKGGTGHGLTVLNCRDGDVMNIEVEERKRMITVKRCGRE